MSKNLRDKPRRQKSAKSIYQADRNYDSSDDDYAGVDLISDSDEEDPDVEFLEEQAIIDSEEDNEADDESDEDLSATPRRVIDDDQTSWAGFDLDDHASLNEAPLFDNRSEHSRQDAEEVAVWSALQSNDEDDGSTTPRRVRFDLTDSSASFSDNEDDIFPDIFLDQNSLDPGFRRAIENEDNEDDGASSDSGSYWDLHGSEDNTAANTPENSQPINSVESGNESSSTSSGYETDEGETTEEDLPPAAKFVPARSVLRRMSDSSASDEEEVPVIRRRPLRPSQRSVPKLASWVHDASKPFAVIDSRGKRLIVFKARAKRRFSFSTGDTPTPRNPFVEDSDQDAMQMSPMISNSANLMMSAMYSTADFDNLLAGQALGPPEAFYPFTSVSADGTMTQESMSSSIEDEDVDDEDLWNVEDFLNFGEASSGDEDEQAEGEVSASEAPSSTPLRPGTATSEDQVHPLLSHFEKSGIVGAFRRNQTRHHLLSRNATTHDGLAFSNPYQHGPIRGIKGGRLEAVNVPITPLRRQKNVFPGLGQNPPESPVGAAQKRKFTGDTPSHKRSRSLL